MIRDLIFDMGNVLIHFEPKVYVGRLGVTSEEEKLLINEVFRSVEWVQMDHGILDEAAAAERICSRVPAHLHDSVRKLVMEWDRQMRPVAGMYELIGELKAAGYGIYLLSNASVRHPSYWPRIPASEFFDGVMVSSAVRIMKPQADIYRMLCERYGLKAEECFFIDDAPANVETALCCGMSGTVFHGDTAELRARLKEAGVLVTGADVLVPGSGVLQSGAAPAEETAGDEAAGEEKAAGDVAAGEENAAGDVAVGEENAAGDVLMQSQPPVGGDAQGVPQLAAGASGWGEQPQPVTGESSRGVQPQPVTGESSRGVQPQPVTGESSRGVQPQPVIGESSRGVQPQQTIGANGWGAQPQQTAGASGCGVQPQQAAGANGWGAQPEQAVGTSGWSVQPQQTAGASGCGVQPQQAAGANGWGSQPQPADNRSDWKKALRGAGDDMRQVLRDVGSGMKKVRREAEKSGVYADLRSAEKDVVKVIQQVDTGVQGAWHRVETAGAQGSAAQPYQPSGSVKVCSTCGRSVALTSRFCPFCGTAFPAQVNEPAAEQPVTPVSEPAAEQPVTPVSEPAAEQPAAPVSEQAAVQAGAPAPVSGPAAVQSEPPKTAGAVKVQEAVQILPESGDAGGTADAGQAADAAADQQLL